MEQEYRGAARALSVLSALNRDNGVNIAQLARGTGISRAALYRILGVLIDLGYLKRRGESRTYVLTSKVKTLSDGFREESWVSDVATPHLIRLQQEVLWPTDLAIFRYDRMELVETTRRRSPFVIDHVLAGGELSSVLSTALGLAYISNASPATREAILKSIVTKLDSPDARLASDPAAAERVFEAVRADGYAWRFRGSVKETGSIAVPLLMNGASIASIGITFFAAVLTVRRAVKLHLDALLNTARDIEAEMAQTSDKSGLVTDIVASVED